MDSRIAPSLENAILRVFQRLGAQIAATPFGLELTNLKGIHSEFLPHGGFEFGCFLSMDKISPEEAKVNSPGFLALLWPGGYAPKGPGSNSCSLLSSWLVELVEVKSETNDKRFRRVEEVPEINAYQSIGPKDGLPKGPWDVFTEWFLFSKDPDHWRETLLARLRITDLDSSVYLCSRWATSETGAGLSFRSVSELLVGQKGGGALLHLSPTESSLPRGERQALLQIWGH